MNTQPEALRLADALEELDVQFSRTGLCGEAAAELRRLHAINEDLLDALYIVLPYIEYAELDPSYKPGAVSVVTAQISEAIAKATGEK